MPIILAVLVGFGRWKQEDRKFEARLSYMVRSLPAWITYIVRTGLQMKKKEEKQKEEWKIKKNR